MLYPQNGDVSIVSIDSVTSFQPMYSVFQVGHWPVESVISSQSPTSVVLLVVSWQ